MAFYLATAPVAHEAMGLQVMVRNGQHLCNHKMRASDKVFIEIADPWSESWHNDTGG